ncbi:MAG: hypothetical protein J6K15_11530 [Lachnospiraceae bacterium]|nr:hypothetical protein [Lachnospiraceae bacterium]MBP3578734.1 hypothetical protein [Lachnospiraceae bacterium]
MKTKLGISVAMMAAGTYLLGLFSGYLALVLIAGYVLLCESDEWLKKSVVKALVITVAFSVISAVIGFIPNAISIVDDLVSIFGGNFSILFLSRIVTFINTVLSVFEKLLMLALALLAFDNKTIKLPVIDSFIEKHM